MTDSRYESYMGLGPGRIAHWEHWSNPDAEAYLTGIGNHIPFNVPPDAVKRYLDLSAELAYR